MCFIYYIIDLDLWVTHILHEICAQLMMPEQSNLKLLKQQCPQIEILQVLTQGG